MKARQEDHYHYLESRRSACIWAKGLTEKLLSMTHSQWLYRNAVVHERMEDGLKREEQEELRKEIEDQLSMGAEGMDSEHAGLLEKGFDHIWGLSGLEKQTWLHAVRAARASSGHGEQPTTTTATTTAST